MGTIVSKSFSTKPIDMTHGSLFSGVGKNYLYCCEVCGKTFKSYNPHPKFCSLSCKVKSQCSNIECNSSPSGIRNIQINKKNIP